MSTFAMGGRRVSNTARALAWSPARKVLAALTKMSAHVIGIGRTDASRSLSELRCLVDDASGRWARLPSGVALRRACNKRVYEGGSPAFVYAIQHAAHKRAQLWSCHRFKRAIEIRIGLVSVGSAKTPSACHSAPRVSSGSRANWTSALGIS